MKTPRGVAALDEQGACQKKLVEVEVWIRTHGLKNPHDFGTKTFQRRSSALGRGLWELQTSGDRTAKLAKFLDLH